MNRIFYKHTEAMLREEKERVSRLPANDPLLIKTLDDAIDAMAALKLMNY